VIVHQAASLVRIENRIGSPPAPGWPPEAQGLPGHRIVGMIADMENLPTDYRLSAEQCRRRADAAVNTVSKASWLRFAEEWMKLADEAELSTWRTPQK
jgi:hypothetical protein